MAERDDIIEAIEGLTVHCRPPLMSSEERARWLMDWCEDLKDAPLAAIKHACSRWRQGEDRRFPTPGQLLPMVRAVAAVGRIITPSARMSIIEWT